MVVCYGVWEKDTSYSCLKGQRVEGEKTGASWML
jgi:hypothetical protein